MGENISSVAQPIGCLVLLHHIECVNNWIAGKVLLVGTIGRIAVHLVLLSNAQETEVKGRQASTDGIESIVGSVEAGDSDGSNSNRSVTGSCPTKLLASD